MRYETGQFKILLSYYQSHDSICRKVHLEKIATTFQRGGEEFGACVKRQMGFLSPFVSSCFKGTWTPNKAFSKTEWDIKTKFSAALAPLTSRGGPHRGAHPPAPPTRAFPPWPPYKGGFAPLGPPAQHCWATMKSSWTVHEIHLFSLSQVNCFMNFFHICYWNEQVRLFRFLNEQQPLVFHCDTSMYVCRMLLVSS